MPLSSRRGQSLIELLIALGIGTLFIIGAIGALSVTLRLDSQTTHSQPGIELANELIEELRTISNADWHTLGDLTQDGATVYQITPTPTFYATSTGKETVTLNGTPYQRYFLLAPVYRDEDEQIISPPGILDPSTIQVTAIAEWSQYGQTNDVRVVSYLARTRNRLWIQTDWKGGPAGDGPTTNPGDQYTSETNTATTTAGQISIADFSANRQSTSGNGIDATYRYGWSDVTGWIDFLTYNNITLGANATTTGYASSSIGAIALDCATSPNGDICPSALFGVMQDGSGNLSGFGWNDVAGWVSFNCASENPPLGNCSDQPGGVDHKVTVDPVSGFLKGWAWSDSIGWISLNCDHSDPSDPLFISDPANANTCPAGAPRNGVGLASNYAVKTGASTVSVAELTSMIFDTGSPHGVALNTLTWLGDPALGTRVSFQIASGNTATGAWTTDFKGIDGTSGSYYQPTDRGMPIKIRRQDHTNVRYIRYKVRLESNSLFTTSPTVRDIIINYSL